MAGRQEGVGWRFQFTLRTLFVAVTIVAAYFAGYASHRRPAMTVQTVQRDARIERLINDLSIPSGALLCDRGTIGAINQLRKQSFLDEGIDEVHPYCQLPPQTGGDLLAASCPTQYFDRYHAMEVSLRDRARVTCRVLALELEGNLGLGKYFNENPGVFETRIRPLLLRLLDGRYDDLNVKACGALLAGGDRSGKCLNRLKEMLQAPPLTTQDYRMRRRRCPLPPARDHAVELNERYKLELLAEQATEDE